MVEGHVAAEAGSTQSVETLTAINIWLFCSVGMMVFNKLAVEAFPAPCMLVGMQMAFTTVVLVLCCWRSLHIGSLMDLLRWMRVVPFFAGVLLTSILALKSAPMSLVVVFRCLAPLVSLSVEQFFPSPLVVNARMIQCILVMLFGAALYCKELEIGAGILQSIGWVMLNNFFAVGDRLLQRMMLGKDQYPVDISRPTCTILNNIFGLIPISVIVLLNGEYADIHGLHEQLMHLSLGGALCVGLSCVVGVCIAYSGVWLQSLISATSFLVLATAGKFVVVIIDFMVFGSKSLSYMQILAASITIFGGVAYGKVREQIEHEQEKDRDQEQINERRPLLDDSAAAAAGDKNV